MSQPPYKKLTVEDGLSQSYVTAIHQDSEGFLWFGTRNGLSRYDGHQFKVFTHQNSDSFSISGNIVRAILEIGDYLLIGTEGNGLNVLNKKTLRFQLLEAEGDVGPWWQQGVFHAIMRDPAGKIWLGITIPGTGSIVARLTLTKPLADFIGEKILADQIRIWESSIPHLDQGWNKEILVGANLHKIFRINTVAEEVESIYFPMKNFKFSIGPDGTPWVATTEGLYLLDGKKWQLIIPGFPVVSFEFLKENNQVLAFSPKEVALFDRLDFTRPTLTFSEGKKLLKIDAGKMQLPYGRIKAIQDRSGIIWAGTNGFGVVKFGAKKERFRTFFPNISIWGPVIVDYQGNFAVKSILENTQFSSPRHAYKNYPFPKDEWPILYVDPNGTEWLLLEKKFDVQGEEMPRLVLLAKNKETGEWEQKINEPLPKYDSPNDFAFAPDGKIWIAKPFQLLQFDPANQQKKVFSYDHLLPEAHRVDALKRTADGSWWIATNRGLIQAKPKGSNFTFHLFQTEKGSLNGIQDNHISTLLTDPDDAGILWIGTLGGGLHRLDVRSMNFSHYSIRNGLFDNVIHGILPDQQGRLWMSSNQGIIRLDKAEMVFKNYTVADGLPGNEFNKRAYGMAPDGTLFFGGVNGLVVFDPKDIADNRVTPTVRLTALQVNNQNIVFGDSTDILKTGIEFTESIELPFSQNNITLEFAALEFTAPSKNKFRYYLKGAETAWQHESAEHIVNYLNLSPGNYDFLIKACNNDGIWSDEVTSLHITILPPWYQTNLAYFGFGFLSLAIVAGIIWFLLGRQKLQYRMALKQQEAERLVEIVNLRKRLFTNITHEFRSPLTVISGMVEMIEKPSNIKDILRRNSQGLLRLITQMLDLAKLEGGQLRLDPVQADIVPYIKYLQESFQSFAASKRIQLFFKNEMDQLVMDFDENKLERIISNLLSNAIKFTNEKGQVLLFLEEKNGQLLIRVQDNGIGISADKLSYVFDRFYQVDDSTTRKGEGTGIGLTLTKELVELMGGQISVQSPGADGKGTEFSVALPIRQQAPVSVPGTVNTLRLAVFPHTNGSQQEVPLSPSKKEELPLLLLIEDNEDVALYIQSCLKGRYIVDWAMNGAIGIEKALKTIPDVIISDVMMPEKDGYEVCHILKSDERTSHIPIVLLTAKVDVGSRLEGLGVGADAYLSKPFLKEELYLHLEKLVELRQRLQEKYARKEFVSVAVATQVPAATSPEDLFLEKATRFILDHIDDHTFGNGKLSRQMAMSESQLNRKIKALMGQTLSNFIRSVRLQQGKILLQTTSETVSEIAYAVGFTNPSYFSRTFSQQFGVAPSFFRN